MPLELLEREVSPPSLENSLLQTERQTSFKPEKKLKCVPADSNLKYRQISDTYIVEPSKVDEESEEIAEGINEELEKEIEKLEKELEELRKSNYFPETKNLLHIEKCYEIK
jgi:chromosome segregation ATPase